MDVIGWYNQKNIGDEAFKDAFRMGVKSAGLSWELDFITQGKPKSSGAILGGGDVIKSFYLDKFSDSTMVFPVGCGLGYESEAELLEKKTLKFGLFRNHRDVQILKAQGADVEYCPDITFILDRCERKLPRSDAGRKKEAMVLLSDEVNPTSERRDAPTYMYYEYFKWELANILDEMAEFYNINFVPFSTLDSIDDRKMDLDIFRRMARRADVKLHHDLDSVERARNLIANSDLVISMKFHGIMFAVDAAVSFINIGETRKTHLFCSEYELGGFCVEPFSLHKSRFMNVLKFVESDEARQRIKHASDSCRDIVRHRLPETLRRIDQAMSGSPFNGRV
jgi:polysaccharide pyruvyl transferase WcaK-like protein